VRAERVACILRREYVESVRKKSFLFGLVATPVIMLAMIFLPLLSGGLLGADRIVIGVLDRTGEYGERLAGADWPAGEAARVRPTFIVHDGAGAPSPADLDAQVAAGELSGWVLLPADLEETGRFDYRSESVTNVVVLQALETRLDRILAETRAVEMGLAAPDVERLLASASMRTIRLGDGGGTEADFSQVYLKAVALVMILFFALIPTGHILMRSVIEEKSNRVIEVLISSVSPLELMVGKVIGLGAVGLTLLGVWAAAGLLLSLRFGQVLPVSTGELAVFVAFFFPGYFFFAALLGSIGSVCSAERDAQPFLTPISLSLMFPVLIGFAIAQNPDHIVARVLSFFPPFTPSLVLFRYAIKPPPVLELVAAWIVLVAATALMLFVAARVFRVGILMTGKRPTIPEMLRWVRTA
jgi:ABC-2 type transport system permease protein